jgi:hypothetical protein
MAKTIYDERAAQDRIRDQIIADAKAAERERCAGIVRSLAVIVGSSSHAFDDAVEAILHPRHET